MKDTTSTDKTPFHAHSAGADDTWESMTQHVTCVADLAAANGEAFGAEEECRFAGDLHDLEGIPIHLSGQGSAKA